MELNVSLSAPADAGKQMLFDMIKAGSSYDLDIDTVDDIAAYKYLGVARRKMQFVVAVYNEPIEGSSGTSFVLSLMTFDLKGTLDVSEGYVSVAHERQLADALAKAKLSDFK